MRSPNILLTRRFISIFLLVAAAGLTAHASGVEMQGEPHGAAAAASSEESAAVRPEESEKVAPGLAGSFLSSRFAKEHEDIGDAARYLKEALAHDPDNLRLKIEVMRAQLLADDVPAAIMLAKQLKDESKTDALVATLLMLDAVHAKQYGEAKRVIMEAPGVGLFGIVRPVILQWLNVAAGENPDAAELQAAVDKSGFFAPFLAYHVALMNDVMGNEKAALENYLKASQASDATPYRVVEAFANFQARHGKWEEAQKSFDQYAKANPDSSLLPDKIAPQTTPVTPLVADANEGLAEVFLTTASILFGEDSSKDTFLYLRVALALRPEFPPAQLMLANLYEQLGEYPKAIAVYDTMHKGTVFYKRGQVRKALNMEALGKRAEAIVYLENLSQQYPNDAIAQITKGDMLRAEEKYTDAAAAYSEALKRSEPLKQSDWPLLYARGISYERAGQWPKAEADFERALTLEPNQPDVLNYLGYSWLVMNKNLKKASEYLDLALSARPEDPHIIDSASWAKFLTGDFSGAAAGLEKAVDLMPEDATVNDHLGDVYWRLGRRTEAVYQWKRALGSKPEPGQVADLHHKIDAGLPPLSANPAPAAEAPESSFMTSQPTVMKSEAPSMPSPTEDDGTVE